MSAPDLNPYRDEPEGSWCEGCSENQPWTSSCPACGAAMCDACERSIGCAHCEQHEESIAVSEFRYDDGWCHYARRGDKRWQLVLGEHTIGGGGDIEQDVPTEHVSKAFCGVLVDSSHVEPISALVWDRWQELRDAQYGTAVVI